MFRQTVSGTPLTTVAANAYFDNIINGECYNGDNSFVATLRALVAPRIKEGESIFLYFGGTDYSANTVNGHNADTIVESMCGRYDPTYSNGVIAIHNLRGPKEDVLRNFEVIERQFCNSYKGFYQLEKVTAFYQKSFRVDCYINPEKKNVVVFVDNMDTKKLHYLQVSILAFLPWYFDKEVGVSELEMELLHSLRETSSSHYESCIAKFAEAYDFKTARIRQLLSGFESRYEKMECERIKALIADIDENIRDMNARIGSFYVDRNNNCIRLLGLERKLEESEGDSEIMEYFICNNKLSLELVDNTNMYFAVKDYLTYFDREMAERAIENNRSFVYSYNASNIRSEDIKKLMREIFVEENPRLRIRFCAAYRFNLNGNVTTQSNHEFDAEFSTYMPNPHINRWNCMGGYERTINELLMNQNYIGAIEQCCASCKSLNFGDVTVMGTFMDSLLNGVYNNRCIELPDGNVVKPVEAIKWLKEQEVKNDEQKEEEA